MSILVRAAIVLLAVFYLFVGYIVANPDVSPAYRDYYILRSTSLSIAERSRLQALQPGTTYSHRDKAFGFDGWFDAEASHRWSKGTSARIIFRLEASTLAAGPQRLRVKVLPLGRQQTAWRVNGKQVAYMQLDALTEVSLPLGKGVLREGENVVEVDLPGARAPGNGDNRKLALAFVALRLE